MKGARDMAAYQIAFAALGLAVAAVFAGICWIVGQSAKEEVPVELWFAAGAISGVLVGALLPFSIRMRTSDSLIRGLREAHGAYTLDLGSIAGSLLLAIICVVATSVGFALGVPQLEVLGTTVAGILLGLPIPSPGRRDP
jgi:predicted membrane protein